MTRAEYAKKRIDEILIELPEEDAENIIHALVDEYEAYDPREDHDIF